MNASLELPAVTASNYAAAARVIFVNRYFHPDVSATSQILYDLTTRLAKSGIEVHVICSRQLYDDCHARLNAFEIVSGVHVHRVTTSRFGRASLRGRAVDYASFYASAAVKMMSVVRRGDLLVAKTDPPLISVVAAVVSKLRGATLINWLQDVFPEVASRMDANPLPAWLDRVLRKLRDTSLHAAATNVVLGTRMRDYFLGRGVDPDKLTVIENWSETAAPIASQDSQLRARLGLIDHFVVGYSGNLGRAHEFETILGAAKELHDDSSIVFLMIGGGAKMDLLKRAVERVGLRNFRFLPYQPRESLADSLAAADVHIACLLPELEGLIVPSKFYGILAAGRPAIFIGDQAGEVARIIRSANCGACVSRGDDVGLVREIRQLQASPERRRIFGEKGTELFARSYTVERAFEKWRKLLTPFHA